MSCLTHVLLRLGEFRHCSSHFLLVSAIDGQHILLLVEGTEDFITICLVAVPLIGFDHIHSGAIERYIFHFMIIHLALYVLRILYHLRRLAWRYALLALFAAFQDAMQ